MAEQQPVLVQEPAVNGSSLRTYSGAPHEDFTAFREVLESSFALGNVTREHRKNQILFAQLRGAARIYYKDNLLGRVNNATFEDNIAALKHQFITDEMLMQMKNLFDRMNQGEQEAPNSYYQRLLVAAQHAEINNNEVIESRFKAGLQPRFANHCAKMGALTFAEFQKYAQALWNVDSNARTDTVPEVFNAYRTPTGERALVQNIMPGNVISPATSMMLNEWDRLELANLERINGPHHDPRLNQFLIDALSEGCSLAEATRRAARRAAMPAFNDMYLDGRWPAPTPRPPRQYNNRPTYNNRPQYQDRRQQYNGRQQYPDRPQQYNGRQQYTGRPQYESRQQNNDGQPQRYNSQPRYDDRRPAPATEANAEPMGPRLPPFSNKEPHPVYRNMTLSCLQELPGFDINEYAYVARVTEDDPEEPTYHPDDYHLRQQPTLARAISRFPDDDQCPHPIRKANRLRRRLAAEEDIRRQNRMYEQNAHKYHWRPDVTFENTITNDFQDDEYIGWEQIGCADENIKTKK